MRGDSRLPQVLVTDQDTTEHRSRKRLSVLSEIARLINQSLSLEGVLRSAVSAINQSMPGDRIAVFTFDPETGTLTLAALHDTLESHPSPEGGTFRHSFPIDGTRFERCLAENRAIYTPDLTQTPFSGKRTLVEHGILSDVLVPIQSDSEIIGAVAIGRTAKDAFTEDERAFVESVSVHLALALRKARMFDELRQAYDDLKTTQTRMVQQERLSAMGTMASGIAHDFNNLLMGVLGYSELLQVEKGLSEKTKGYARRIEMVAKDAQRLVSRLRDFYRAPDATDVFRRLNLDTVVQDAISLTMPRWQTMAAAKGAEIRLETGLGNVPDFLGNGAELRDMLTNLILNAVDAMPKGGTLAIRTRFVPRDRREQDSPTPALQGRRWHGKAKTEGFDEVVLEVTDTGTGMTDEVRERCLEPFFSTKGRKGTGLGLAMVYGAVQRHNGVIEIDSQHGQGTTFRIRLFTLVEQGRATASRCDAGQLRVLVVDDEPHVRELVSEYLTADGHTVATAENGEEALEKFVADRFALVVTDKVMPELGGEGLVVRLRELAPQVPVILLTAMGQAMQARRQRPFGVSQIVNKPIIRDELRRAIANVFQMTECPASAGSDRPVLATTVG